MMSKCQNTGAVFTTNSEVAVDPDMVDKVIYGRLRGLDDEANKFY